MTIACLARALLCAAAVLAGGCSTAPKEKHQEDFQTSAKAATEQFMHSVNGLDEQVKQSAGYVIFPNVGQISIILAGTTYGRGALYRPDGTQLGWAALNTGYFGPGVGAQGFRMLMVLQDEDTLKKFMANQLGGNINGQLVGGKEGGSATSRFQNGVVVYEGANKGLIAGIDVGLNYIRYRPLETKKEE